MTLSSDVSVVPLSPLARRLHSQRVSDPPPPLGVATLGGVPFLIDPTQVQWDFDIKAVEKFTVGGKVVQVFGTRLGDMVVSGTFGAGDRRADDTSGWEYQLHFFAQVKRWARQAMHNGPPLRFLYPPRSWDFHVYLRAYSGRGSESVEHAPEEFNPAWTLTLFIVSDNTGVVVTATKDIYIARMMAGVGWKQTQYNGPQQADVDKLLQPYGGNINSYLQAQYGAAASGADSGGGTNG